MNALGKAAEASAAFACITSGFTGNYPLAAVFAAAACYMRLLRKL